MKLITPPAPLNNDQWKSSGAGKTATRPGPTTASLAALSFPFYEIYVNAAITQRLLDDAQINVKKFTAKSIRAEFNKQEGIAFLPGDGTNKPAGLLTFPADGANENPHPGGRYHCH